MGDSGVDLRRRTAGGDHRAPSAAREPATPAGVAALLRGPRRGCRYAVPIVDDLLAELAATATTGPARSGAEEFTAVLTVELARYYLRAVCRQVCGGRVPAVWRHVFDGPRGGTDPARSATAVAAALVDHDLPMAVVSACTLLGAQPGPMHRTHAAALAALIMAFLRRHADAGLPARPLCWRQIERLWALRGWPAAARAERAALDRRAHAAALVGPGRSPRSR